MLSHSCKKKIIASLSSLALGASFFFGSVADAQTADKTVLFYADNQSRDYPTVKAAKKFAKLVKERTDGRIQIKVCADAKLGDEKTVADKVRLGEIDFARVSLASLTEYSSDFELLMLPYLYRDDEHMQRVLASDIGKEFLTKTDAAGIVGLSWYDAGVRSFYLTKAPVKDPADMDGLNIRVQESALMLDTIKAMGATPVSIIYADVYDALENGTIDGAENNLPSYASMKHYKIAKFYCRDEHTRVPEMQIAAKTTLEKLTADEQKIIRECAAVSAAYERELWAKREKSAEKKVLAGGALIVHLTDEERQKFAAITETFYDQYDENQKAIIAKIKET